MPTDTFSIAATADDKEVRRVSSGANEYPPAGTITHISAAAGIEVARTGGGTYTTRNICLKWNTSSLPDTALISAALLRVQIVAKSSDDSRSITCDWYVFDGTSSDYSTGALTTAHAGTSIASLPSSGSHDFSLISPGTISTTSITGLRMHVSGGQPTAFNQMIIADYDHSSLAEAQLLVTYTVPENDLVGMVGV